MIDPFDYFVTPISKGVFHEIETIPSEVYFKIQRQLLVECFDIVTVSLVDQF